MDTQDILKTLTEATGPSGREGSVCDIIKEQWTPYVDEIRVDAMGNLIAVQNGCGSAPRPKLMLAAHMDEIGLIVTGIAGEFLRVHSLGGIDRRVLLGLDVLVHGRRPLPGIIGTRPPHVLPPAERRKVVPWEQIFVDVGLPAEAVKSLVRVGDHITVDQKLVPLKNNRVAGKAMDNRASVAIISLALEQLQRRDHAWDVLAVATVQEEVGLKGAITSAYSVAPDLAIALDVTFAKEYDDSGAGTFAMDKGPTLGIGPNLHPQVVKRLQAAADAEEIAYQMEPLPGSSGTDAWGIQVAREGIPTGLVSVAVRYMHQPVELLSVKDVERAARLLVAFTTALTADYRPGWDDESTEKTATEATA